MCDAESIKTLACSLISAALKPVNTAHPAFVATIFRKGKGEKAKGKRQKEKVRRKPILICSILLPFAF
jgi:hypothetical protein